jgi:hypothetical protein
LSETNSEMMEAKKMVVLFLGIFRDFPELDMGLKGDLRGDIELAK